MKKILLSADYGSMGGGGGGGSPKSAAASAASAINFGGNAPGEPFSPLGILVIAMFGVGGFLLFVFLIKSSK
jgi:hypothetical protein